MKFRAERNAFVDAIAWAGRTVPARPSSPVLAGLRLEVIAGGTALRISSFDRDVQGQVEIEIEDAEPGVTVVNGRLLVDIAKSLPAKPVDVVADGTRLSVHGGRAQFDLPCLPPNDFPDLPEMPDSSGKLSGSAFSNAVGQVAIATRTDDALQFLTGVKVEVEGTTMTLAATDRYRLAVKTLQWTPLDPDFAAEAVVPGRVLSDTAKAIAMAGEVNLAFGLDGISDGLLGVEGMDRRTTMRILAGEFPKYRSLLPATSTTYARVETGPLIEAVKRVSLVAEQSAAVRMRFTDSELLLESGSGGDTVGTDAIECTLKGEPLGAVAFNAKFIQEGLTALGQPVAEFALTEAYKPVIIKGAASFDAPVVEDYLYLIMPIRQV